MKFKDPLASTYYLGGTFPTHVGMLVYSAFALFNQKPKIKCGADVTEGQLYMAFQDVAEMFAGHIVFMICYLIRCCLNQ
jgi:hypothetical protein